MKKPSNAGEDGPEPLRTITYLSKFTGLSIEEADSEATTRKDKKKTIILKKWVRRDFPDMGYVSYDEVDPR